MQNHLTVGKYQVQDHLRNIKMHKSVGSGEMHPQILRQLVNEVAKPLFILFEKLWQASELPTAWKRRHISPIFEKGNKEDTGNYRPVSGISVLIKIMEQSPLETMLRYMENNEVIADSPSLRANFARQICLPSMTGLQYWWIREDKLMSSAWACTKHFTLPHITSSSLNCGDTDLMDGPLGG